MSIGTETLAAEVEDMLRGALQEEPAQFHLDSRKPQRERDQSALHVTEVVSDCMRAAYFRLSGETPDAAEEEESRHWAHTGTLYEEWVRAVFRARYPGRVRAQVPMPHLPEGMAGTCDLWWADRHAVLDVKSRSVNAPPPDPDGAEARQVATYAAHLTNGEPVHALIVQVPREDLSRLAVYPVRYDRTAVLETVRSRAEYLTQCRSAGTPPPALATPQAPPCAIGTRTGVRLCPWWSRCHGEGMGQVLVPPDEAMQTLMARHRDLSAQASALARQEKALREGEPPDGGQNLKELAVAMAPWFEAHGTVASGTGDQDLKRIPYPGRESWDLEEAFAKRPSLRAELEPYRSVGTGYFQYRWVKKK